METRTYGVLFWSIVAITIPVLGVGYVTENNVVIFVGYCFLGGLGILGYFFTYSLRYQHWKANRKKNLMPLSYRMRHAKIHVRTLEGKPQTLTSRGVIGFFTILAWIVTEALTSYYWRSAYVTDYYLSSAIATAVLISLVTLYFVQRQKSAKFVPKPKVSKVGLVAKPIIIALCVFFLLTINPFGKLSDLPINLVISGIGGGLAFLGYWRSVRKSGYAYFSWKSHNVDKTVGDFKPIHFKPVHVNDDTFNYFKRFHWWGEDGDLSWKKF